MKSAKALSRSSLLLQFSLFSAILTHWCLAQPPTTPATQTPTPPANATTQNSADAQAQLLAQISAISATTGVPTACISRLNAVQTSGQIDQVALRKVIDFKSDQLCSLYLVLASSQYQNASKAASKELLGALLSSPGVQQAVIKDYKTLSQQTGSSSGTGGTTNLVSKGAAARILSFASEYGAVTESTSGQTTTVAGTLAGIPLVLLKNGIAQNCSTEIYSVKLPGCLHASVVDYLNRISYSIGFDTSTNGQTLTGTPTTNTNSSTVPTTFTASTHNINAITAKWIAIQGKPATPDIQAAVKSFEDTNRGAQGVAFASYFDTLEDSQPNFAGWQDKAVASLSDALHADIAADAGRADNEKRGVPNTTTAFKHLADGFVEALGLPENSTGEVAAKSPVITKAVQFAVVYAKYLGQEEAVSLGIARPALLTIEYDDNRPASQPSNSVFRVIYQAKLKEITLTANGAASIYDSTPSASIPGAGRLRDVQVALGADHDFSLTLPVAGKVGMSASGNFYFQNQQSPAILNVTPGMPVSGVTFTGLPSTATQVFAQKGNIAVGQLKLTVGSGSSINVPLSVTYSNRTELVTSPVWRGQVGISYDFDSLFQSKK
jgi:hypothetical protein